MTGLFNVNTGCKNYFTGSEYDMLWFKYARTGIKYDKIWCQFDTSGCNFDKTGCKSDYDWNLSYKYGNASVGLPTQVITRN